jgi:hypothetical protein
MSQEGGQCASNNLSGQDRTPFGKDRSVDIHAAIYFDSRLLAVGRRPAKILNSIRLTSGLQSDDC